MLGSAIEQTTDTTGTGAFALVPSTNPPFRSFVQGVGNGAAAWYRAEMGSAWEEGFGVVAAGTPDTLTRTVAASSNGNALVNWPAGTKRVFCIEPPDGARFGNVGALPTAGGTANALTLTHAPACRVLRPGMAIRFVVGAAANTAAVTLNVDGLGALPVQLPWGDPLTGGELTPGSVVGLAVNANATAFRALHGVQAAPQALTAATATLPAGGWWEYDLLSFNASGAFAGNRAIGKATGGTVVGAASAGITHYVLLRRVG